MLFDMVLVFGVYAATLCEISERYLDLTKEGASEASLAYKREGRSARFPCGSLHQLAPAIGTCVFQDLLGTTPAERAFEGTDLCFSRLQRQADAATFTRAFHRQHSILIDILILM